MSLAFTPTERMRYAHFQPERVNFTMPSAVASIDFRVEMGEQLSTKHIN